MLYEVITGQTYRLLGQQAALFSRLGQHHVAADQGRGNLAAEDGQREIPGADADEQPATAQAQAVLLAGSARQELLVV